jgi:hypothetical protein
MQRFAGSQETTWFRLLPPVKATAAVEIKTGQTGINDLQIGVASTDVGVGETQVAVFSTPHDRHRARQLNAAGDS